MLLAVALIEHEDGLCPDCSQPVDEAWSPLADPDNRDGTHVYEAPLPTRCYACTAVASRAEGYSGSPHPQALRFHARRVDRR